jgi:hypothetical protein
MTGLNLIGGKIERCFPLHFKQLADAETVEQSNVPIGRDVRDNASAYVHRLRVSNNNLFAGKELDAKRPEGALLYKDT